MVAKSDRTEDDYAWAYAATSTESGYPSNNGWDIGYAHDKQPGGRAWYSPGDYHPVRVDFTAKP